MQIDLVVMARSTIGEYLAFVYQLLIALAFLMLSSFFIKKANHHLARAFVLAVFTSLFYKDAPFTVFAALVWVFMTGSAFYIKENKKSIYRGIVLGIIASLVGYYSSLLIS